MHVEVKNKMHEPAAGKGFEGLFHLPRSYQHLFGHQAQSNSSTTFKYVITMVH